MKGLEAVLLAALLACTTVAGDDTGLGTAEADLDGTGGQGPRRAVRQAPSASVPDRFRVSIEEETVPVAALLQIQVKDAPQTRDSYRRPRFIIQDGRCRDFYIDQLGRLFLYRPLDYDSSLSCSGFKVSISHPDYQLETRVEIAVTAVNDIPPRILSSQRSVDIPENTPPGEWSHQLSVQDRDRYEGGLSDNITIQLSLYPEDSQQGGEVPFAVRYDVAAPTAPRIVATRSFDHEAGPRQFTLRLRAWDGRHGSSSRFLDVHVLNVNDEPPSFSQDLYSFPAREASGDVVVVVVATDPDSTTLDYGIGLVNGTQVPFGINSAGRIRNTRPLDAESLPPLVVFTVVARDEGGLVASARVEIAISDVNEFQPVFVNITRGFSLPETTPPGFVVYQVTASDGDIGPVYGKVTYSLVPKSPDAIPFKIGSETGVIVVAEELDYETVETYDFLVVAQDGGGLGVTGRVFVEVEDVHDVPPCPCNREGRYEIAENQRIHLNVWRVKVCGGLNARDTHFALRDDFGGRFSVDAFGRVFVTRPLDHEHRSQYTVNVSLSELQFLECPYPASLTVTVTNRDEFLPVFAAEKYALTIGESTPPGPVLVVKAFDADSPDHVVTYSIVSPLLRSSLPFSVSDNGTVFLTRTLDYDNRALPAEYVFSVSAVNNRNQATLAPTLVTVRVNDSNDEPPLFPRDAYHFFILENGTLEAPLFTLEASDADTDPAHNTVSYSIPTSDVPFRIRNSSVGEVTSEWPLDYEVVLDQPFVFEVLASDGVNEATAAVQVTLRDRNEHSPEFPSSFVAFNISLDVSVGETVGRLAARDRDGTGRVVDYVILPGGHVALPFRLDHTGLLTAHFTGDAQLRPRYRFGVAARDQDGRRSVPVVVEVAFEGLSGASIPSAHCLEVGENLAFPEPLVTLDDHYFGPDMLRYFYTLLLAGGKSPFSLQGENGRLLLEGLLDYEAQTHYELDVSARNQFRLVHNVSVAVCVLNLNDNPPRFAESVAMVTLPKDAGPLSAILEVPVVDDDDIAVGGGGGGVESPLSHWCCLDPDRRLTGRDVRFVVSHSDPDPGLDEGVFAALYNSTSLAMTLVTTAPAADILKCRHELSITAVDEEGRTSPVPLKVIVAVETTLKFPPLFGRTDGSTAAVVRASLAENGVVNIVSAPAQPDSAREACTAPDQLELVYSIQSDSHVPFSVDGNGTIANTRSLDYETDPHTYSFVVKATNTAGLSSTQSVVITLTDMNEFCPVFTENLLVLSISELTMPGYPISVVMATDQDGSSENNVITYSLVTEESTPIVSVTSSGHVTLIEKLEFVPGGVNTYQFQVQASNSMGMGLMDLECDHSSILTVSLNVSDANDKPPSFDRIRYMFEVNENESASVDRPFQLGVLEFSDPDTTGEELVFKILSTSTSTSTSTSSSPALFIDSEGTVFLTRMLDYEVAQNHSYRLSLSDGVHPAVLTASLVVVVLNANEHSPAIDGPLQVFLAENVIAEEEGIAAFSSIDRDLGLFGTVQYSIDGLFSFFFRISKRGAVFNTRAFDFEYDPHFYVLVVKATDGGGKMATHLLTINITDSNDEAPMFEQDFYLLNISEMSTEKDKPFFRVRAFDSDISEKFRTLNYSLVGKHSQYFSIQATTGELSTVGHLDYEGDPHQYSFSVVAMDTGGLTASASVNVNLLDSNDNSPTIVLDDGITMATNIAVRVGEDVEEGSVVVSIRGVDKDATKEFGEIANYTILSPAEAPFTIGPDGIIKTLSNITRHQNFTLVIVAIDNGGRISPSVQVTVTVTAVNKAPPLFTRLEYSYSVQEGKVPSVPIASLQAVDPDQDPISYKLVSGPARFVSIDLSGNVYIIKAFDFETDSHLRFEFKVNDSHFTSKASAVLAVKVLPVNEFKPVIASEHQLYEIPETTPPGTYSFHLTATDDDQDVTSPGHGDVVAMTMSGPNPFFAIDYHGNGSATVTNIRSFDFESQLSSPTTLRFLATDGGGLQSDPAYEIAITVIDENDNKPVFVTDRFEFTMLENKAGLVGHVTAHDSDLSEQYNTVVYSIVERKTLNPDCPVDARVTSAGEIFLDTPLNYECVPDVIILVLSACDVDPNSCSNATVAIFTEDVNEYAPSFTPAKVSVHISESTSLGTAILTLTAEDKDRSLDYGRISHYESKDISSLFEVTPGGVVRVIRELDYETQLNLYNFSVLAFDGQGKIGSVAVTVTVSNSNEFPPTFVQLLHEVKLAENFVPSFPHSGHVLTQLSVVDRDLESGEFIFQIKEEEEEGGDFPFEVLPSGEVVLKRPLDYELSSVYEFTVEVSEGNQTSPEAATVRVLVQNTNDNAPFFSQSLFEFSLHENSQPSGPLGFILAQDQDGRLNPLTFYVAGETPKNILLQEDGGVVAMTMFDYETLQVPQIEFEVKAFDGVHYSVNATKVIVRILPVNDLPPSFLSILFTFDVPENGLPGDHNITVPVIDGDLWPEGMSGGNYTFQLHGSPLFYVKPDPKSPGAVICITRPLDFETDDHTYNLSVTVDDGNFPSDRPARVVIRLTDVNDHAPVFVEQSYEFVVPEDSEHLGRVEARDRDGSEGFRRVHYSLEGRGAGSRFSVSPEGGLSARQPLDYEEGPRSFRLVVEARDEAGLTDRVEVTVTVVDVNDHAPFFLDHAHTVSVPESHPVNSTVLVVQSHDLDATQSLATATYSIRTSREVPFVVNGDGEVLLAQELDYESAPNFYAFVIVATDTGGLEGSTSVEVTVGNVPDTPPCPAQDSYLTAVKENTIPEEAIVSISILYNDGNGTLNFAVVDRSNLSRNIYLSSEGLVTVVSPFDYETVQRVSFNVSVSNGFLSCPHHILVSVVVLDQNEFEPVLEREEFSVSVDENSHPESLLIFKASDQDGGNFGDVIGFQLENGDSIPFFTTQNGSLFPSRAFDAESDPREFQLQVFAVDAGGAESKRARVTVTINDINEHEPKLRKPQFSLSLWENTPVNTTVLLMGASDLDRDSQPEDLSFSVLTGQTFFGVTPTGGLILIRELDFETQPRFARVTVKVEDLGGLSSQTVVVIRIRDVNEHAPKISSAGKDTPLKFRTTLPSHVTVYENTPQNTSIPELTFLVTDDDDGDVFGRVASPSIVGVGRKYFSVRSARTDQNDTLVTTVVKATLDLETGPSSLDLQFMVCDGGNLCIVHMVTVAVGDVNEFPPQFSAPSYSIAVPETTPTLSHVVFSPAVTDGDAGRAGQFACSLEGSTGPFAVRPNCSLYLLRPLDFCTQSQYSLTLTASNPGNNAHPTLSGSTVVMVTVPPVNVHPVLVRLHSDELTVSEASSLNVFDNIYIEDADCHGSLTATVVLKDLDHKMTAREGLQTKGFTGSEGLTIKTQDQAHISVRSSAPAQLASYLRNAIYYNHDDEPTSRHRVILLNVSDGHFFTLKEIVVRIVAQNDHLADFHTTPNVPVWFKPPGDVATVTLAPHLGFEDRDTGVARYKILATLLHDRETGCDRLERAVDIMLAACGESKVLSLLPNPTWGISPFKSRRAVPFISGSHLGYYFERSGFLSNLYREELNLDTFSFVSWVQVQNYGAILTISKVRNFGLRTVSIILLRKRIILHILGSNLKWDADIPKSNWIHISISVSKRRVTLFLNGSEMGKKTIPYNKTPLLSSPILVTMGTSSLGRKQNIISTFEGALSGAAILPRSSITHDQILGLISCSERMDVAPEYLSLFQAKDFNRSIDPFTGYLTFEVETDAKTFEMVVKSLVYRNSHTHPLPGRRFTRVHTWDDHRYLGHYGTVINVLRSQEYSLQVQLPTPPTLAHNGGGHLLSHGGHVLGGVWIQGDEKTKVLEGLMVSIASNACAGGSRCSLSLDPRALDNTTVCALHSSSEKVVLSGLAPTEVYSGLLQQFVLTTSLQTGSIDVLIAVSDFNSRHGDMKTLKVEIEPSTTNRHHQQQ